MSKVISCICFLYVLTLFCVLSGLCYNIIKLTRCSWLGGRKGNRPAKNDCWVAGVFVWGEVQICTLPS